MPPGYKLIQERRSFLLDHGRERTFEIAIRICAQDDKLHAETRCPTICPLCAKSCREQVQQKSATERQVPSLTAWPTTRIVSLDSLHIARSLIGAERRDYTTGKGSFYAVASFTDFGAHRGVVYV